MKCARCGSGAVMPIGVCLSCGFQNAPAVDPRAAERERQAQELAERKARSEAALARLREALALAEAGDLAQATRLWNGVTDDAPEVERERLWVESELWRLKGVPEKRQMALERLVDKLPFDEAHLQQRYDLACLYEAHGAPGKAFRLLNQFVDRGFDYFQDDILERWRRLKAASPGAEGADAGSSAFRVRVGAMDRTAEAARAWIDEASRARRYFSDSILLNEDFKDPEAIDRSAGVQPGAQEIVRELTDTLRRSGFAAEYAVVEQRIALQHEVGAPGQDTPVWVLRATAPGPLRFESGSVNLAVHVIARGRAGVSLAFYELFTPHDPEDVAGPPQDVRSFNDSILDTLMRLRQPDPARHERLRTLREEVVKRSIERLLERSGRGAADLFY